MRIGIIGAMEEETIALKNNLTDREDWAKAGATFSAGKMDEHDIVLVQSGIGKVNAAIATTLLIHDYQTDIVINTGSAGAIDPSLAIGDVVISSELAYHDADARAFGYVMGQVPQMPARYPADGRLIHATDKATQKVGLKSIKGVIVTSDSFIADKAVIERIKTDFPDALVSEMEGAAVAQVCYQFKVPFVIVRAVSDTADDEAGISFDKFIIDAGKKSAEMVMEIIQHL
ncbi:5'-methylthioadenosine/adenosylhomocysteine nucleosidase [Desemzia sp. RIT804]|uniref:5'-methylthioadenosine/adenosylhomocysteine nucleosidase n=1 Tax=Desemzia sp. RIT 804 TaxID=2810209 RepID=UPI001950BF8B|nr:5'-methylthioadenosine/adenosylhomocysteine nucleosidase [Desemzia sp. RIT 804]MBM6613520.1 5'-methylthioadenosine/adenosylhomocysteine nucleosidase [Desemzia sp. RIT 804]